MTIRPKMGLDFRKEQQKKYTCLKVYGAWVGTVSSYRYFKVDMSEDLMWTHTSILVWRAG